MSFQESTFKFCNDFGQINNQCDFIRFIQSFIEEFCICIPYSYIRPDQTHVIESILFSSGREMVRICSKDDGNLEILTKEHAVDIILFLISINCQLSINKDPSISIKWEDNKVFREYYESQPNTIRQILDARIMGSIRFKNLPSDLGLTEIDYFTMLDHIKKDLKERLFINIQH